MAHYPYSEFLQIFLAPLFPSTKITIDVSGLSGDQVIEGTFLGRVRDLCNKAKRAQAPYDWVIVLGGTNDLGWFKEPADIYEGLSMFFS